MMSGYRTPNDLDQVADHRTVQTPEWEQPDRNQPMMTVSASRCRSVSSAPGHSAILVRSPSSIRVVPLEPAIHATAGDARLSRDGRDLAAVDVRAHGASSAPFGEVILEFGLDDERVELFELRRATTCAADGLTGLGARHDRVTMILPRSGVKCGSQAARSCLDLWP